MFVDTDSKQVNRIIYSSEPITVSVSLSVQKVTSTNNPFLPILVLALFSSGMP